MASDFENAARQRIRLPGLHQKSQLKPRSFRAKSGSSPRRARRLATRWTSWRCKPARWPSTMVPRLRAQRRGPRRSPNRKTRYPSSPQPSRELLGQLRGPSSRGTPDQLRELSVQPQMQPCYRTSSRGCRMSSGSFRARSGSCKLPGHDIFLRASRRRRRTPAITRARRDPARKMSSGFFRASCGRTRADESPRTSSESLKASSGKPSVVVRRATWSRPTASRLPRRPSPAATIQSGQRGTSVCRPWTEPSHELPRPVDVSASPQHRCQFDSVSLARVSGVPEHFRIWNVPGFQTVFLGSSPRLGSYVPGTYGAAKFHPTHVRVTSFVWVSFVVGQGPSSQVPSKQCDQRDGSTLPVSTV